MIARNRLIALPPHLRATPAQIKSHDNARGDQDGAHGQTLAPARSPFNPGSFSNYTRAQSGHWYSLT